MSPMFHPDRKVCNSSISKSVCWGIIYAVHKRWSTKLKAAELRRMRSGWYSYFSSLKNAGSLSVLKGTHALQLRNRYPMQALSLGNPKDNWRFWQPRCWYYKGSFADNILVCVPSSSFQDETVPHSVFHTHTYVFLHSFCYHFKRAKSPSHEMVLVSNRKNVRIYQN